jgi:hypothetical protein
MGEPEALSAEESKEIIRIHRKTCTQCTFAPDSGSILAFYTREQREAAYSRNVFVGYYYMKNWRSHLPFYIFWCNMCDKFTVDYPHGNELYFAYSCCGDKIEITDPDIYKKMEMTRPPTNWRTWWMFIKYLWSNRGLRKSDWHS